MEKYMTYREIRLTAKQFVPKDDFSLLKVKQGMVSDIKIYVLETDILIIEL